MIKEHRHDKIKSKHIYKFECLVRKYSGYHHNHQENSEGHPLIPLLPLQEMCFNKTTPPLHLQGKLPTTTTTTTNISTTTTTTTTSTTTASNPINNPAASSDFNHRWVLILLTTPLSSVQLSLLSRGPNFAVTPKHPPKKPT